MVPGVEGRHTFDGLITLNDLEVWPRYEVTNIDGLHSRADFDLSSATGLPVGRRGEIPRRGFRAGKTVVFEGRVMGRTLAELHSGRDSLEEAFDVDDERQIISAQHPTYGSESYSWRARCALIDIPDSPGNPHGVTHGHHRPFILGLRMSDPRFFGTVEQLVATAALSPISGLAPPFTPPVIIPGAGTAAGSVVATNDGRTDTDPVIDLYGPVLNPVIENQTLGVSLRFNVSLAVGSFLRVDFANRRITFEGTSEASSFRDQANSDWWDPGIAGLAKGGNTLRYSADTISDPAVAQVRFYDAFLS